MPVLSFSATGSPFLQLHQLCCYGTSALAFLAGIPLAFLPMKFEHCIHIPLLFLES